jgi:hypothetical protein
MRRRWHRDNAPREPGNGSASRRGRGLPGSSVQLPIAMRGLLALIHVAARALEAPRVVGIVALAGCSRLESNLGAFEVTTVVGRQVISVAVMLAC